MDERDREKIEQVRSLLGVKSERIIPPSERAFVEGPTIADVTTAPPSSGRPKKQLAVTREDLQADVPSPNYPLPEVPPSLVAHGAFLSPSSAPSPATHSQPVKRKDEPGDLPLEAIRDLTRNYDEVVIRLTRKGERGVNAVICNGVKVRTKDLLRIDAFAAELAGGGGYKVEVRDPYDLSRDLIAPFSFVVEGPPKPPRAFEDVKTKFEREEEDPTVQQRNNNGAPNPWVPWQGVPYPSAAGFSFNASRFFKRSKAKARERDEVERLRTELDKLRDRLNEREREIERERFQTQLQALTQRLESKPSVDWSGLASAMAPVLAALVSSRSNESQKLLEAQVQLASLAQQNKQDPVALIKDLSTTLQPILTSLLERSSPASQAQLMQAMTDNSLSSVAMMAQLVESFAREQTKDGDEEPWWVPYVKTTLENVLRIVQANAAAVNATTAPSNMLPQRGSVSSQPVLENPDSDLPIDPNLIPEEFRTKEWLIIFEYLHKQDSAKLAAEILVAHLTHLILFGLLPAPLAGIVQGRAQETLEYFFQMLPVCTAKPDFCREVISRTLSGLESSLSSMASQGDTGSQPTQNANAQKRKRAGDVIPLRKDSQQQDSGDPSST